MSSLVKKLVDSCIVCKITAEFPNKKTNPGENRSSEARFPKEIFYLDVLPMPAVDKLNYLLIAVDAFSNYVMAVPLKNKSSLSIKIA